MKKITGPEEELDLNFFQKIKSGSKKGFNFLSEGWILNIPFIAMDVATAQKGEILSTTTARSAGLLAQPAMAGLASAGLVATLGLPPVAAAVGGVLIVGVVSSRLEDKLIKGYRTLNKEATNMRSLSFGQAYKDNQTAKAMRMQAVQEMNYTMTPSRRWLGQEARILHR